MPQGKNLSIALICLAAAVVIASIIVGSALRNAGENIGAGVSSLLSGLFTLADSSRSESGNGVTAQQGSGEGKATLDLKETAVYLSIPQQRVLDLVAAKESGIPYLKLGDTYVFSKRALDKWLETARVEIN